MRHFLAGACLVLAVAAGCSLARAPLSPVRLDAGLDAPPLMRDGGPDSPGPDTGPVDGGPLDARVGDPLGAICSTGATCGSSHCSDGVCCDMACDGPCEGCTSGIDGTCTPALAGSDPANDCPTQSADTCGTTGVCDGAGACARFLAGTVCGPSSCTSGVVTLPPTCIAGACAPGSTMPCTTGCSGAVCAGSCIADSSCASTEFCRIATGVCVLRLANGAPETVPTHCASGFIADGVCCESACIGRCEACLAAATGAADGECRASSAGTDPDSECALADPSTCGTSGACDGARTCGLYASGTVCQASSCTAGTESVADLCSGTGACVDAGSRPCDPYVCGAATCLTSCASDPDCMAGRYCTVGGTCVAERALGQACTRPRECASGFCTDSVCCSAVCGGACQACTAALRGGGAANGTCGPILSGNDPGMECAAAPASTCSTSGTCDGAGGCALYPAGSVCAPVACAGSTLSVADACDGSGVCVDGGTTSCAPYACAASGTACRTSCTVPSDCSPGGTCSGGVCGVPQPNGAPCSGAAACGSGFCVDNVCCDGACSGACVACTAALRGTGADGNCGPINSGTDPANECASDPVSSCDTTGTCNGAGSCSVYSAGTICIAPSCAGSTLTNADTCDGVSMCIDGGLTACAPYACNAGGTACRTSCTIDTDCAVASYCDVSVCRPRVANGTACSVGNSCASGFCVDTVCCNVACGGTCMSCAVAGSLGTCSNVPLGTADGACVAPNACNGGGACLLANGRSCSTGSQCASNACVDGVCCESTCTGNCRACDLAGTVGLCRDVPAGQDPDNECGGGWDCNGSGGCQP